MLSSGLSREFQEQRTVQDLSWSQGYLLPWLKVRVGESRHPATLVGEMDVKQEPWVGDVRANHADRAKERRGPKAGEALGTNPGLPQDSAL